MIDTWVNRAGSQTKAALDSAAHALWQRGWSADGLTHLALATGVLAGGLFYLGHEILAVGLLVASALLDAIDGRVARLSGGSTPWGGVLDLTFDRVVEAAVFLGAIVPRPHLHEAGLVVVATWYINISVFLAVGAASERRGEKVIDYPPGLLERGESLAVLLAVLLFPSLSVAIAYVYAGLELITGWQRFRHGQRALRR